VALFLTMSCVHWMPDLSAVVSPVLAACQCCMRCSGSSCWPTGAVQHGPNRLAHKQQAAWTNILPGNHPTTRDLAQGKHCRNQQQILMMGCVGGRGKLQGTRQGSRTPAITLMLGCIVSPCVTQNPTCHAEDEINTG